MLFDFKFDWDDSLNVGIPEIDTQHQEFFRIGRSIEQLILTGCKNITEKELLELLCEYVQIHNEMKNDNTNHNYSYVLGNTTNRKYGCCNCKCRNCNSSTFEQSQYKGTWCESEPTICVSPNYN